MKADQQTESEKVPMRQSIFEWLLVMLLAIPIVALYILGDRTDGLMLWVAWGGCVLTTLCIILWAVRSAFAPSHRESSRPVR